MSKQPEMFPPTALDKLHAIRKEMIADSEKADEALSRAQEKSTKARMKVFQINEVIEAVKNGADLGSGEVD